MSEDDLVLDLKASLQDAASVFTAAANGDFKRHLKAALLAFATKRTRTLVGTITLVADQAQYAAPADFAGYKSHLWGIAPRARCQPWEKSWPGRLPDVRAVETSANPLTVKLQLDPPPTSAQISALGSEFRFWYFGVHIIHATANQTTIQATDRGLLLLRAQAEAMRELTFRGVHKPVQLRDGVSGAPRNSTPSALYQTLLDEFGAAA